MTHWQTPASEVLRARPGLDVTTVDRAATPGWPHGKRAGQQLMQAGGRRMSTLQEKLFAHGRTGGTRSVLLVLQGMDTAGKGGIVRHVLGMVDPQGVQLTAFGPPTQEELAHDFLWRVRKALPAAGRIGVFDRSHYEDVLVARVAGLVPRTVWEPRFEQINAFERELVASGTAVVKVALLISRDEQRERLRERLERPDKHWKFSPSDIDARAFWDEYQEAYQDVIDRTSTEHAPWFAVPADRKWYARLAVTELVLDALDGLGLSWPVADFDVAAELARLEAS